ncbi:hypothetical protein L1D14_10600 [Vibrio tubiashii]|uniref:hypothetical protein n=1 Tax=Vibrio tubiashii TaxID=29498 RepID=UPI001EFD3B40|nr:hypothetical protein [Vibrio tubiashii]MCG9576687.1 hypothetical protein [Vibrio tubiashii]
MANSVSIQALCSSLAAITSGTKSSITDELYFQIINQSSLSSDTSELAQLKQCCIELGDSAIELFVDKQIKACGI